jgi:hypothetical protein
MDACRYIFCIISCDSPVLSWISGANRAATSSAVVVVDEKIGREKTVFGGEGEWELAEGVGREETHLY